MVSACQGPTMYYTYVYRLWCC